MSETLEHNDDRALAGEYVLGLLTPEELRAFEARLASEPELAAAVALWREDFVSFADEVAPVKPNAGVKRALDARLFGQAEKPQRPFAWLRMVLGGLALTVASIVAVMLLVFPEPTPDMRAEIAAEDASLVVAAAYFEDTGYLELQRKAGRAGEGRSLELWLIEGGNAPVSLGVMPETEHSILKLDEATRARLKGGVLAVSDEPKGGSPTGAPTGAVLAVGNISDA